MTALATDTFNRADAATLGANWTKMTAYSDLRITSNTCRGTTSADNAGVYTAVSFPNDQYSKFVLGNTTAEGGPTIRSNTTSTFYLLNINSSGGAIWEVYKNVANTFTQISSVSQGTAGGDSVYLEAKGTAIVSKRGAATINNFTDAAIGSGSAGIYIFGVGMIADTWEGGDFGGGAVGQPAAKRMGGVPGGRQVAPAGGGSAW